MVGELGPNVGGAVLTLGSDGTCRSLRVGTSGACATFPVGCAGGCAVDPTLAGVGLTRAAFVAGALYVVGIDESTESQATPIYAYAADGGLSTALHDRGYLTVLAGP